MKWLIAIATLAAMVGTAQAETLAYKMMVINGTASGDRETVEKRFAYLLPRFAEMCSDQSTQERSANMIVAAHKPLGDAGIPDTLLQLTETLYRTVSIIAPASKRAAVPLRCAEVFAFYVTARRDGMTADEARNGVTAMFAGLLNLITE